MSLTTRFTELLGLSHPIAQAPMGDSAGGALAAAVSDAGALGMVGGGRGDRAWLQRELDVVVARTTRPWGVGFLAWATGLPAVEHALTYDPAAVLLSFGDPAPFVARIRETAAKLIVQVVDLDEAQRALEVGADVIVAQGAESGGHGARAGRSTLSFVPLVVDLAGDVPVLAAGGISDGRGVAAALALGAAGALLGSRFQVTPEALVAAATKAAILASSGADTVRSGVLDIARESGWPTRYAARTLTDPLIEEWRDREPELATDADAKQAYRQSVERGERPALPVWVNEAVDLINDRRPARQVVEDLAATAERALRAAIPRL